MEYFKKKLSPIIVITVMVFSIFLIWEFVDISTRDKKQLLTIGVLFILACMALLYEYGKNEAVYNSIDKKLDKKLDKIHERIPKKFKIHSECIYTFANNAFVSALLLSFLYLDTYCGIYLIIFFLLVYLCSIFLIKDIDIKTLERKYLNEFLIGLFVGIGFGILNIFLTNKNKENIYFFIIFTLLIALMICLKLYNEKSISNRIEIINIFTINSFVATIILMVYHLYNYSLIGLLLVNLVAMFLIFQSSFNSSFNKYILCAISGGACVFLLDIYINQTCI